jgi:hypothetical protein
MSVRSMQARVRRLEHSRVSLSPIVAAFGSFAAFETHCDAEIAGGRLDPRDFPVVIMCLRGWSKWQGRAAPPVQRAEPQTARPVRTMRTAAPVALPMPAGLQGFAEPRPWDFDGCRRREQVLDHDLTPPRVVRRVGWQHCLRCRQPFWSEDVVRLRLCAGEAGCLGDEDRFAG